MLRDARKGSGGGQPPSSMDVLCGSGGRVPFHVLRRLARDRSREVFLRTMARPVLAGSGCFPGSLADPPLGGTAAFTPGDFRLSQNHPVEESVYPLAQPGMPEVLLVGRGSECQLIIPDYAISRVHARLLLRQQRWHLEDCGSTNGTGLNGNLLRQGMPPHPLEDGDDIRIGRYEFTFLTPDRFHNRILGLPADMHLTRLLDRLGRADHGALRQLARSLDREAFTKRITAPCLMAAGLHPARMVEDTMDDADADAAPTCLFEESDLPTPEEYTQAGHHGRLVYPVTPRLSRTETTPGVLLVGRELSCDLVIPDATLSRRHARLHLSSEGDITLEDLGSTNGTSLNDRLLEKGEGVSVVAGDRLRFGRFLFDLLDPAGLHAALTAPP
ncbi:MAG: FHA domain-containing protein [Magnetococcus sp. WYHC-3]